MEDNNWGQLLKRQDNYVHEEDYLRRQRHAHFKQLYKIQLQNMINDHKNKSKDQKIQQRSIMEIMKQKELTQKAKEEQRNQQLQQMKEYFAHQNLNSISLKRHQHEQALEKERRQLHQKFRKAETEMSEEKYKDLRKREKQKQQLANAHDQQLQYQSYTKSLQKQQDRKYSDRMVEIQNQQEKQRILNINRIKFGYRQNPQAYDKAEEIYSNKAKQMNGFIEKMAQQNQRFKHQQENKYKQQEQKQHQLIEASRFNRQTFQNKQFQRRHNSVRQALLAHQQWETINQQIQRQKEEKTRTKVQQRNKYKQQLERQIEQISQKKQRERMMSTKESRLNRSVFNGGHSNLPGMSQDHSVRKQQHIMQNFLSGSQHSLAL